MGNEGAPGSSSDADFDHFDQEHLAAIGAIAIAFGHVEFLAAQVLFTS